jgi:hypothetical protein
LIKYSDEQGALAKAVLSPHRARMMFEEVFAESEDKNQSQFTKQPPAKAGGFELRTGSPDTRRLNDASMVAPP